MSQDLLERIFKNKFNHNADELITFLLLFKKNEFIYPSTIKNKFKYDDKEVYEIFNILEEQHLVKMYYEFFCYTCNRPVKLYDTFSKIEDKIICDNCETPLIISKNNIKIIYQVIK